MDKIHRFELDLLIRQIEAMQFEVWNRLESPPGRVEVGRIDVDSDYPRGHEGIDRLKAVSASNAEDRPKALKALRRRRKK